MADSDTFFRSLEQSILRGEKLSESQCREFKTLPPNVRSAYAHAMEYLGCNCNAAHESAPTLESDRVRAARLMLLTFQLNTGGDPCWSSFLLDCLLETVMKPPGAKIEDLFHALYEILEESPATLGETMAYFIVCVLRGVIFLFRDACNSLDMSWMVQHVVVGCTPAQAYLACLSVPSRTMTPLCAATILRELANSPYWEEALNTLSDDFNTDDARRLLAEWIRAGVFSPDCQLEIERRFLM